MAKSIGLDLVEIARIETDIERYGERFAGRLLGEDEKAIYDNRRDKALFLAGRLAAKEAAIKALGQFLTDRPAWSEIQVVPGSTGLPQLKLSERVRQLLPRLNALISITHEKTFAAAVVVLEEDE
ncbi:MAG: holo-ACP synthase [Candidatus Zixiibacteriota bacterium]|nr:MAG: holo-ACP synthase [candidate division Zixibacteria bacterium]